MGREHDIPILKNKILIVALEELRNEVEDYNSLELLAFIEQIIDETPELQKFKMQVQNWTSEKRKNWLDSNCL